MPSMSSFWAGWPSRVTMVLPVISAGVCVASIVKIDGALA